MAANNKIVLTAVYCVVFVAFGSFGQNAGNRYVQMGFTQDFGQDAGLFGQGDYAGLVRHAYPQNSGQGYNSGWNGGYQQGVNAFNPYRKLGYAGYQIRGLNGGPGFTNGGQFFGVQQPAANFVGNHRIF